MAIEWQTVENGTQYEVRSAGNTRRLYTNGVLHTQYNPVQAVTGNIWDLLFLPALLRPENAIKRVLILGVGGGAVLNLLNRYLQPEHMIGVDLNRIHLKIADEHFSVKGPNIQLIHANALHWVKGYNGKQFDLIIDDLFVDENKEPVRALEMDRQWATQLFKLLNKDGLMVMNFVSTRELKQSALFASKQIKLQIKSLFVLKTPQNENSIAAVSRDCLEKGLLRQRIRCIPVLNAAYKSARLRYSIRRLI